MTPPPPKSKNLVSNHSLVSTAAREALMGHKPVTVWFTGLSGAGKSTLARESEGRLS